MKKVSPTSFIGRWWIVVVTAAMVCAVGFTISRLARVFGSHVILSAPSADIPENTVYNPKRVRFEVFGSAGAVATINYLDPQGQPQRVDDAPLPWSQLLTTNDPTMFADLRAQGNGTLIGCRIVVNDVLKQQESTSNVNGYISCLEKSA